MKAFSYVDFPTLSEELINEVYTSVNEDIPLLNLPFKKYRILKCSDKLHDHVSLFFKRPIFCGVQLILDNQGVHIDYKRTVVYNYIIETGGPNVTTSFYNNLEKSKKIESVCIEPLRWHKLLVFVPHQVEGMIRKRIAISAWEK